MSYWIVGEIDDVRLPAPAAPLRTEDLWRTTCFEAFLAHESSDGYRELNFSPSTQWAAYDLESYRDPDRRDAELKAPPAILIMLHRADRLLVTVDLSLRLSDEPYRLGLSAVIEEADGTKSYWALAHPDLEEPDFHHPDCFALELPPLV